MHGSGGALRAIASVTFVLLSGATAIAQPAAPEPGAPAAPAAAAPELVTVKGRAVDPLGRPVRGAQITTETVAEPVTTDRDGRFTVEVPVGATLLVTAERHDSALARVTGAAIDDIVLLIDLASERIEVGGEAPTVATGAAVLDREDLQRLPGTGGDVVRA